tara:strand:- start:967 stop:1464 length:498 start_codon:yes stop_codon:yes gene_type:complete
MDITLGNKSRIYHSGYGYSKKRCSLITNWFLNTFLPRHHIDVTVHHRGMIREDAVGYCDWIGTSYNPRDFEIELQSGMDARFYTETLLHELVHLRQWVQGTLKMRSGKFHWKNEDIHHIEYLKQPHEVEAFREEGILYRRFMKEIYDVTVEKPIHYFPNRLTQSL